VTWIEKSGKHNYFRKCFNLLVSDSEKHKRMLALTNGCRGWRGTDSYARMLRILQFLTTAKRKCINRLKTVINLDIKQNSSHKMTVVDYRLVLILLLTGCSPAELASSSD
jgi:hypothetical protein